MSILNTCLSTILPVLTWTVDSHPEIIGTEGTPRLIETALGKAVEFNGASDGVFLNSVPVSGMEELTIEVILNQYGDAAFENRLIHIGEVNDERIMIETRVVPGNLWYADLFVAMHGNNPSTKIMDPEKTHPAGKWYNLTLVCTKSSIKGYVDGVLEGESPIEYRDVIRTGKTSVGMRQNLVSWFRGAIYKIRISPGVLSPDQFLKDQNKLNSAPGI